MDFCECGKEAIILTSWTNRNPGRRFYGCPDQGSKCRFIGWFDQNQCQRCMDIIPGLLRAKNQFAVENKNLQEQLKALKSEASKMRKMLIFSWIGEYAMQPAVAMIMENRELSVGVFDRMRRRFGVTEIVYEEVGVGATGDCGAEQSTQGGS
ncbi:hypothetical protein R6Q59_006150 [Mikania micrantha]